MVFGEKQRQEKQAKLGAHQNAMTQQQLDLKPTSTKRITMPKGRSFFMKQQNDPIREVAYNDAQKRFEAGVLNPFNFSQLKQRYEAAVSDGKAKYDYIFKLKVLEFFFGAPLTL